MFKIKACCRRAGYKKSKKGFKTNSYWNNIKNRSELF